jgi:hypothetical protein
LFQYPLFIDLHEALLGLQGEKVNDRLFEAIERLPPVSIVGVGGFPIRSSNGVPTLLGVPVNPQILRRGLVDALGASAVLTYLNPKSRGMEELGERCLRDDHTWALHSMSVTLCFSGQSSFVEASFGRDGSFMKGGSWVEADMPGDLGRIFTVHGSLKAWKRYVGFRNDPSFRKPMREALQQAWEALHVAYPDVFKGGEE